MPRYFVYDNATRRFKAGEYKFQFEVIEQFAGAWRGVLKLEIPEEIAALETFAARFGVREITEAEYEEFRKKKANPRRSPSPDPQRIPAGPRADLAVTSVSSRTTLKNEAAKPVAPATADSVVVLGKAPYVDVLDVKTNKRSRKK